MADWPNTLPAPLLEGYSVAPAKNVIRTDFEVGAPRARRRSKARLDRVPFSLNLKRNQIDIFRAFYEGDAGEGAIWFNMNINTGSSTSSVKECRFTKPFEAAMINPKLWRVTCEIEVRG